MRESFRNRGKPREYNDTTAVVEDTEFSDSEEDLPQDTLYEPAREGKARCPDYWTSILKKVLGAGDGKMKQVDGWIASALMASVLVGCVVLIGKHLWKISSLLVTDGQVHAVHASRAANDITFCLTVLLVCLVWHTLSFQNRAIKAIWTAEAALLGNVMTGGFFPRPAAASMGLLLFVKDNMLETSVVTGDAVGEWESCVANSQEVHDKVNKVWFQRFHRTLALGCHGMDDDQLWTEVGAAYRHSFLVSDLQTQIDGSFTDEMVHPVIDGKTDSTRYCTYSCSKFQSISVSQLVCSIGEIFAGAAVVTKFCDYLTTRVGWSLLTKSSDAHALIWAVLGVKLPDEDELERAAKDHDFRDKLVLQLQGVHTRMPGSPLMCALQLLIVLWVAYQFTPTITIDGFFTVDYYTTFLMFTSALIALTLRLWSPYSCRSVVYTRNLWTTGKDTFFEFNPHHKAFEARQFDLYDWMHVPAQKRAEHLLHSCRSIGTGEMAKLYNKKGFIPDLEAEDKKNHAEKDHAEGEHNTTDMLVTFIKYIFCPWRLCQEEEGAESDDNEKTQVITVAEVHVGLDFDVWKVGKEGQNVELGAPILDKKGHRVVIADSRKGVVTKLSKTAGEVMVFFPKQADGCHVCFYMGEGDSIKRDANYNILNKAVLPNCKDGWEFSMPMGALRESSVEWAFARKLLGVEALKTQMGR